MTPKYVGFARVSSREQEREGFSLDVQEDALSRFVERNSGEMVRLFRVAETASKKEMRSTFHAMLDYAKEHARELDGLLFYKVDRAARNLFDFVEIERIEQEYGVPVLYVSQPTENSPAGKMQIRMLANMATFYTEQQSLDVREGMERRVQSGLFVGLAPYGYRNVRVEGRGEVVVEAEQAAAVRTIFELYAHQGLTIDGVREALEAREIHYTRNQPRFTRSKVHKILRDRAYLGEVRYRGEWLPGTHPPLVDADLFERVQALLGAKVYQKHGLTYAGNLIKCGHCGRTVTGETVKKKSKNGVREYLYYRCAAYTAEGHPRIRVREAAFDEQVLAMFERIRIQDDDIRDWFRTVLREMTQVTLKDSVSERKRLHKELRTVQAQADTLLNMRLNGEVEGEAFQVKNAELTAVQKRLGTRLAVQEKERAEEGELVLKAFELSQSLKEKWLSADGPTKRRLLDIVCLNFSLEGESLVFALRKPFDLLADDGFLRNGRGERI